MCNIYKPEAPKGYRHKNGGEYRLPKAKEWYISSLGGTDQAEGDFQNCSRWILEPIPKPAYVEKTVKLPLPREGYEWVQDDRYDVADYFRLKPIRKTLDWSKVSGDVLVCRKHRDGIFRLDDCDMFDMSCIYEGWQSHLRGDKCPIDTDACVVEIRDEGRNYRLSHALDIDWSFDVIYRVTGLVDGYEYP